MKILNDNWIFRGMPSIKYVLQPGISRSRYRGIKKEIDPEEEANILQGFVDRIRLQVSQHPKNDLEWLTLGRHYGLPTRLLDWSASILVAAYFATGAQVTEHGLAIDQRTGKEQPVLLQYAGVVYAVRRPQLINESEAKNPLAVGDVRLVKPAQVDDRIARQSGLMTIHPLECLKRNYTWRPPRDDVRMFRIRGRDKLRIHQALDRLGVNEMALFPGVGSVAQYLGWRLKWRRLP